MGFLDRFKKSSPAAAESPGYSAATPPSAAVNINPGPARRVPLRVGNAPAVDRTTVEQAAKAISLAKPDGISLTKAYDRVGVSLSKRDLTGIRAEAVLLLDHSGSMYGDYRNGNVHNLVLRSLAFALQIDADGKIPVIRFDSRPRPPVEVTMSNAANIMDHLYDRDQMGSTDLTGALEMLREIAQDTDAPIFALVITDGQPNNASTATKLVTDLARYPVFLKFIAIDQVPYLEHLDEMPGRLVDNANAQFIPRPAAISDADFAEKAVVEWDLWVKAALAAGILFEDN